jgi:hypothetical protein
MSLKLFTVVGLALFIGTDSFALTNQDFWVDYHLTASVRKSEREPWTLRFNAPFGVRVGYGSGLILREVGLGADQPNCYDFSFTAKSANRLASLFQNLKVTAYHGDSFCDVADEAKGNLIASFDITVIQDATTVLQLPFLAGEEVKFELNQNWKPAD